MGTSRHFQSMRMRFSQILPQFSAPCSASSLLVIRASPHHPKKQLNFLDAIASPSTYPSQSVGQSVIDSFRFGDSYRISELCELVYFILIQESIGCTCDRAETYFGNSNSTLNTCTLFTNGGCDNFILRISIKIYIFYHQNVQY